MLVPKLWCSYRTFPRGYCGLVTAIGPLESHAVKRTACKTILKSPHGALPKQPTCARGTNSRQAGGRSQHEVRIGEHRATDAKRLLEDVTQHGNCLGGWNVAVIDVGGVRQPCRAPPDF